ncbi:MAG: BamA/TamA family outer membrane protein [Woeseiaceae bacterium]
MQNTKSASSLRRTLATTCLLIVMTGAWADSPVQPRNVTFEGELEVPALPDDVDTDNAQQSGDPEARGREFVIVPIPSRTPLLGWTLQLPAMYFYKPAAQSDKDPAWITGAMALYTEDGGWGAGLFQRMNLAEDRWRLMGAAAYADLEYDFYGIGGDPDTSIPLNQTIGLVTIQALRRVSEQVYVGLRIVTSQSEISLDINDDLLPPGIDLPEIGTDINLTSLAPRVRYDSRNNEFSPSAGMYAEASVTLGRSWLGSDSDYEKWKADFNHYRAVSGAGVLATRVAMQYLGGEAPFFVYPAFGSGADLRGYETGAYRDRFLFAAQTEYRHRLRKRLGVVAFGGVGTIAPEFANWEDSLWSVGAGIRWVVAPENDFSLRIDIARGRTGTQFYVGLGEAF